MWKLGVSPTVGADGLNQSLGLDEMRRYFSTLPDPNIIPDTFDFDRATRLTAQTAAINDPTSTYLTSSVQRGGRLLIYQGMSDPDFSANDIMAWYDKLAADEGSPQDWARLFLIQGMDHCAGGPAAEQFDALSAIHAWVEQGNPPEGILATGVAFPAVARRSCAYPKLARYTGEDASSADSFTCKP